MACSIIRNNGKTVGFICGDFQEDEVNMDDCSECGDNWPVAEFLCDYPVGNDKTCDRKLCRKCAKTVGKDMHCCPTHHAEWNNYQNSELGKIEVLKAIESGKKLTVIK
ncbi:hypothetical protein [Shewanella baltica]|uniref:hypothetical protein n=1 Tax=Shewanella baltica TaxID=62322 RepID=UPI003D7A0F6A